MKRHLLLVLSAFFTVNSWAIDLVVQEAGPVGTYASIGAAVAASTDGDRIIINNRPGGFPWNEDILINKTLTFLSAVDNDKFFVQGDYDIQHAPGREVTIIGMENVDGDIANTGAGGTSRTIVNLMWCELNSGAINLNAAYFELNASGCQTSGNIQLVYGKVVGNTCAAVALSTDALVEEDSVHIVGNICVGVFLNSTSHYCYVSNNYIFNTATFGELLTVSNCKNGTGTNVIRNNSLRARDNAMSIGSSCSGNMIVYNNIFMDDNGDNGLINQAGAGLTLIVSFNYIDNTFDFTDFSGFTNDGTNVLSSAVSLNGDGSSSWTGTTDGGSPSLADYDLDLTRNDPGCFGGSYSHANFFPIDGTSSRVYYLQMPSEILVGGSNQVTGHSYDR